MIIPILSGQAIDIGSVDVFFICLNYDQIAALPSAMIGFHQDEPDRVGLKFWTGPYLEKYSFEQQLNNSEVYLPFEFLGL